jgi:predicted RNase H-like HicB family nuclease
MFQTRTPITAALPGRMLSGMNLNAVIERDLATGLLVGSVPGIPGAHTQGETIEEVRANLAEVIELLREEGALKPESEFIATTALQVA